MALSTDKFPPPDWAGTCWCPSWENYQELYKKSIEDPNAFWGEIAEEFYWEKKWDKVEEYDWGPQSDISIKYFTNARTNITYNALDRHVLAGKGDKVALLWEGNEPGTDARFTYAELLAEVCKMSNVLKAQGVKKGDRVSLYMPMVPQLAIAMMACARIGAIHSIVFGGFSAESLADRIMDSTCIGLLTTDGSYRGLKPIPMKANADRAMDICTGRGHAVKFCIVYERVGAEMKTPMTEGRDFTWASLMTPASPVCPCEWMDSEDPLFILYTSGSTGPPKGVLHTIGGYMVFTAFSFRLIFDYKDSDIFWCTADIGWVTGHSYIVYGPLVTGATTLMFEGIPTYPNPGRFWDVVDKFKVTIFYTAPTAIRALAREGESHVLSRSLASLRLLGTVGEPINPEAWLWYWRHVGRSKCPIVDTWWQTETGGILITPLPGATTLKPGSATFPFFGVKPIIMDDNTKEPKILEGAGSGKLCIAGPWPGIMRTVYGDHKRFKETYFCMYDNMYYTGDGARRDEEGYIYITGRVDDVINVSGHRLGTAEVESALVAHSKVAEAAVVGFPHDIKGQGIYAYVTLIVGGEPSKELQGDLVAQVRKVIGPIATPDVIHWAPALPKTRSGKIMRRILRKIAANEMESIGDISTLNDPAVVQMLIDNKP